MVAKYDKGNPAFAGVLVQLGTVALSLSKGAAQ
jgi:hypothetical protein